MVKKLLLSLFLSSFAFAGDIAVTEFSGLATQDNPAAICDGCAQDLLNVDIVPGGKGVKKRDGYGLHKTVTFSTSAIHGGHYFQDTAGSDVQVWGGDVYLNGSVNGASYVQLASGTLNATWQCADSLGYAYCLTSSRNMAVRTAGTTATTTYENTVPLGTMVTFTPDRMVVSGVSGNESTLYFSKANTPTTFTTGVNTADAFTEVINAPGSRINHIRYACGKLLWWKDASFGYSIGTDQFNLENVTISPNIGTLDNSSDEYNGHVYFRGQDSHIYDYDCANVTRLSRPITPTVKAANRRRANSWTQTSQTDWNTGAFYTSTLLSASLSAGDVTQSSITFNDTSSNTFVQGFGSNITYQTNDIIISTNAAEVAENSFESGIPTSNWLVNSSNWAQGAGGAQDNCTITPQNGSIVAVYGPGDVSYSITADVQDYATGSSYGSTSFAYANNSCTFTQRTITVSASALRKLVIIKFSSNVSGDSGNYLKTAPFVANSRNVTFYSASDSKFISVPVGTSRRVFLDTVGNTPRSSITTANYTSRTFDTALSSSVAHIISNWTVATTTPYFELQTTSNSTTGPWTKIATSTGISGTTYRYLRYLSSYTLQSAEAANTTIDDVTVVAKSTGGVYFSAVNNASGVTSWNTFSASDQTDGGTLTYYVRASTGLFIVASSTPVWVAQNKNATVNYATGTYMQARIDFTTQYSTGALALNDFTFNWIEGAASDKAYIKYHNDNVWVAVSSGTSGLNNRILRLDLLNQTWLLDDIAANGFVVDNGDLYFGSPTVGKIYKFGQGLQTDDSGPINSYWRSKNFSGSDPFVQNTWDQLDFVVKQASGTFLSVDYRVNGSTVTNAYSINLYDPLKTILHRGNNLPGKIGTFFNVQFGDNSSDPKYEVLGFRAKFSPLPWRPE